MDVGRAGLTVVEAYGSSPDKLLTLVGDVQLYLDLYADAGRGREQAEFLRQQRLRW